MRRRHLLLVCASPCCEVLAAGPDLREAVNKAGRQRMLSQRMSKAYLALAMQVEPEPAHRALDRSVGLFDKQLSELHGLANPPAIAESLAALTSAWGEFRESLLLAKPVKAGAPLVLSRDAKVLQLSHQTTLQYELWAGGSTAQLINLSGRQRMLTQRMAKLFMAVSLGVAPKDAMAELNTARTEFMAAMQTLRGAAQGQRRILDELQLADGQWVYFDSALRRLEPGVPVARASSDVFMASENLLTVMENVTAMFGAMTV